MLDEMRRLALFTSGVAELTMHRAEQIVKSVMGESGGSALVKQLVEASRQNRREMTRLIASEMRSQVEALGLATRRDLERLERRIDRLERRAGKSTRKRSTTRKSTTAGAKKSTARKKTTARKRTTSRKKTSEPSTGSG